MKRYLLITVFLFTLISIKAIAGDNIYWIQFNTKQGTPYSVEQPGGFLSPRSIDRRLRQGIEIDSTDLPVNPAFTDSMCSMGFHIKHTSRWMNGAVALYPDSLGVDSLSLPSFVSFIKLRKGIPVKSTTRKFDEMDSLTADYYGSSADQLAILNGQLVHNYSKGEGVVIAVLDAGFQNADKLEVFDSLYARGGVLGTYDFVNPGNNVYNEYYHGTSVLSVMAADQPGKMVGTAPYAMYWLLRSEDVATEYPVEEDYWIVAAEFADSAGCDVINTSLGYTTFYNSAFNHTYGQFTGDSLRISKAANMAVKKGIVVVCSAGNEGANAWHYISAPSEARDVLSIAAVDNSGVIAGFSSRGFGDSVAVLKPDVAAVGSGTAIVSASGGYTHGSGTSFSSPVIAGMAACMVGIYPDSTASSIIRMIRQAGDRYPEHSDDYGYGIPDFSKCLQKKDTSSPEISSSGTIWVYPNPFDTYIHISDPSKVDMLELFLPDGHRVLKATKGNPVLYGVSSASLAGLQKGIYFARIQRGASVQTIKLIRK